MKRSREEAVLPLVTKRAKGSSQPNQSQDADLAAFKAAWAREPVRSDFSSATNDLIIQQMDIDYTMGDPIDGMPGSHVGKVPIIRMFGLTNDGHSTCLLIHGVIPYFYVEAPPGFTESDCEGFRVQLNMQMQRAPLQGIHVRYENYILHCEIVHGQSIMGYSSRSAIPMIKISLAAPMLVPSARKLLEAGFVMWRDVPLNMLTYESNVLFVLRYMIDQGYVGADWVKCPAGSYQVKQSDKISRCQIEAVIGFDKLVGLGSTDEWDKIAPLRVLSFDIECCAQGLGFPDPTNPGDQVIQIANYVMVQGQTEPLAKVIFNLDGCAPIVGAQVLCYEDEATLLNDWAKFIQILDPDVIIGYNIANFDFWYVLTRAKLLGAAHVSSLSRLLNEKTQIKNEVFSSKAYGRRETKTCALPGRVQFDIYQVVQRDYKLRSYSLNSVSAHFLGQQKEDVQYNIIGTLFRGSDNDRKRLAVYCLKDAQLPFLLMDKLMMLVNYLEMARVTGVPVSFLLSRGQQIKVLSQLYRKARERNLRIPAVTVQAQGDDVAYTGAVVIDPLTGYYDLPISTLDFNSLYPTIMIAHNLCYTTLLSAEDVKTMPPENYIRTPNGDYFVKSSVQEGILPEILQELLAARKKAKRALAAETDPFKAAVQNGRQLALKVSANSVYGFTGALRGKLPCLSVSASVTAFGREMIDRTKELVEEKYTIANGYKHDAIVVYGDTDSVMVKFGGTDIAESMDLGKEAAEFVTAHFVKPINLEFEKAYFPYLLMSKKRYAGLLWTRPEKYDKMDAKGIVTVRRDNCPLVKEVIDTSLHKILIERDPRGAEEYVKRMISDLLQNRIDLSLLVITKALAKSEYKAKQAHVELTNRMHKRDPGTAPNIGDRVPYVIVQGAKDARAYEKAEDPLWALEHGIPLDNQYYLDHQLSNPLTSIFTPILGSVSGLLSGDHTLKVVSNASASNPLSGFLQRSVRCMNCRVVVKSDQTLCEHCKGLNIEAQVYQEKLANVNELELKFSRLWTQCQSCQGSFHQPVLCTSRDCPIFYMRTKVRKDLQDAQGKLARFKIDW